MSAIGKYLLVCSQNDPAGTNIRDRILENFQFSRTGEKYDSNDIFKMDKALLATSSKDIVFVDDLDEYFHNVSGYVFLSRHRAESGIPSLTTHFTGNFGDASFGGRPSEISYYDPNILKTYYVRLKSLSTTIPDYVVTLEATHHGPTCLKQPVMFAELGSSESQWGNQESAKVIALAIMDCVQNTKFYPEALIGIGGTHYSEKFNKLLADSEYSLGVVVPKYALNHLDETLLRQIISKSVRPVTGAAVDMKGLGTNKRRVLSLLEEFNMKIIEA